MSTHGQPTPPSEPSPSPPRPPVPGESPARLRARARRIAMELARRYPEVRVPLRHRDPLQLLVATILSAQCTDATVNRVTPHLFARFPTARDLAEAPPAELEQLIHPTGFFRQKARMIQETCRLLLERHGGEPPRTMGELTALPGVGRKTANVLLSAAHLEGWPGWRPFQHGLGIVVDTHVSRLSRRLGWTARTDPARIEEDLQGLFPRPLWPSLPLRLIAFGREVCTARKPACQDCPLARWCPARPYRGATPWLQNPQGSSPEGRSSVSENSLPPVSTAQPVSRPVRAAGRKGAGAR